MKVEISGHDFRELMKVLRWSSDFIYRESSTFREKDNGRKINMLMKHIKSKNSFLV